jgi:hypothetical protein
MSARGFKRVAATVVPGACALTAAVATAAGPPVVSLGPVSTPGGAVTATGTADSGGQSDACVNGQHSGTNPSSSDLSGAALVNDSACQAAGGQAGGSQTAAPQTTAAAQAGGKGGTGPVASIQSVAGKRGLTVVSAAGAVGLRITRIQYSARGVRTTRLLRVLVTLRDRQGRAVRGGIVTIGSAPGGRTTIGSMRATFSDGRGQAAFKLPLRQSVFGKRLFLTVIARTPTTHVRKLSSTTLPRLTRR